MARRIRHSKRGYILFLPAIIALLLAGQHQWALLVVFLLLYVAGTCTIWVLLFMATNCDVITITHGTPCRNPVRGRLRGCAHHRRDKRAVWLSRVGIKGPLRQLAQQSREARRDVRRSVRAEELDATSTPTVDKPVRDIFTVVCTLVSTVSTAIGTIIAVLGLVLHR